MTEIDLNKLPATIQGERVLLVPHEDQYMHSYYETIDNDRKFLSRFLYWTDLYQSPDDPKDYFKEKRETWASNDSIAYLVLDKNNDKVIGSVGCLKFNLEHHWAELNYWLTSSYNGKGYMTECIKLLEKELYELGFHRLLIEMDEDNDLSKGVPERNGYTFEGIAREDRYIKREDRYRDTLTYSKLKHEWEAQQKA